MFTRLSTVLFFLAVGAMVEPSAAHEKDFVNVTGDTAMVPNDCNDKLGISQGGVCYAGGHIVPTIEGEAVITVFDQSLQPISGCHQQAGQLCEPFCAAFALKQGVNWDPSMALEIFIDGPVLGNRLFSTCAAIWSGGVYGTVGHS